MNGRVGPGARLPSVLVVGAGGHGRVVASVAAAAGRRVLGFLDDDPTLTGRQIDGFPVIGTSEDAERIVAAASDPVEAVVGIGDNRLRRSIAQRLRVPWATLIHPFSWVHSSAQLGPGTVVCAGTIVQPGAHVGAHVILNTSTGVEHDCVIGDYAHLAVSHVAGAVVIEEGAFLGVGTKVIPQLRVGEWAIVGAGAVVIRDVRPGATVVGVPAKELLRV